MVAGSVVSMVTGVPLMVVTILVGDGVETTTLVEPPMLVVMAYEIGWKPEDVEVTGTVVRVPPITVTCVCGGGVVIRVTRLPP